MSSRAGVIALLACAAWCGSAAATEEPAAGNDRAGVEFFERRIRPLLVGNCYTCHSADTNSKGGLRTDDRNGLINGGDSGPAVVPGKPEESVLLQAVRHEEGAPKMPPKKRLTEQEVADLERWIKDGAAWPEVAGARADPSGRPNARYETLRKEHWAWQPLVRERPPRVRGTSWPIDDIDRFVLATLEARELSPSKDADRVSLIRRATFDLTGLPPTPEEVVAFERDCAPGAFERVVDRLLASPAFGERWGRHWLDVARYGESTGSSRNLPYPHAWRYRDYVIDAFNRDKPFDRFVREQVAGDLLPAASARERQEQIIATGFLALGVKDVNQRFKVRFIMDNVDEQIDAVSRSVLALTASCARCHDHKFDPIPQADYYAMAGIFQSTDLCAGLRNKMGGGGLDYYDTQMLIGLSGAPGPDPARDAKVARANEALAAARAEFIKLRDDPDGARPGPDGRPRRAVARQKMVRLQNELLALTDPAVLGQVALGVRDAKVVGDTQVRIRGEAEKIGPTVPRGFLGVVASPGQPKVNPRQSGRQELAAWLTSPENPLAPRVLANRVWQHLIGEGLVKTVDNFGVTGDVPSHPALLDHLAVRLVRSGWSVKSLVRSIVLSRTYQLSTDATPAQLAADPSNRLLWRHSPRRLDAEEIRDATLAAAGTLDPARPAASPARDMRVVELRNNGPEARRLQEQARASVHRSVYLPLLRGITPTSLEVLDFAEQGMVAGRRDTTTVAPQALYFLNDPFVCKQSLALARRLLSPTGHDGPARVDLAYRLVLGRPAASAEVRRATAYLREYESAARGGFEPDSAETPGSSAAAEADAAPRKPVPANPDEADQTDEPVKEEITRPADATEAAWASFCQALFGSAEFRYLR
jgi:cytochrome c553